jgi:hypothetical protein
MNWLKGMNCILFKSGRTGVSIFIGVVGLRSALVLTGVLTLICSGNRTLVFGQESAKTEVTVKIPNAPNHEFDYAEVTANGQTIRVQPGKVAPFNIAVGKGEVLSIQTRLVHTGFGVKTLNRSDTLNGSGHANYSWELSGGGIFEQWPMVTFVGSVRLDVWIDGAVMGTTEISKGVAPGREHTFEWKNGDLMVCTNKMILPANVTRTYSCNAATKKIEQQ